MRIGEAHLTYCMNVHPARTLADVIANIRRRAAGVRRRVSPDEPFGVGLWLPATVAAALRPDPSPLREALAASGLYAFTINGFPYGVFHGAKVKTAVYSPCWGDPRRLAFTRDLIHLLAALLPLGVPGSISTLPVCYGKDLPPAAIDDLAAAAAEARRVGERTGQRIRLGLEPEPDCYLEDTPGTTAFFDLLRRAHPDIDASIGVCFDTCHLALQGEDLAASWQQLTRKAGISVTKTQLSAALVCDSRDGIAARQRLTPYDEPVYLHQTRVFHDDGSVCRYVDLGEALEANAPGIWRVHFHVPLTFAGHHALGSTASGLTSPFLRTAFAECPNIEVETYSFGVLPGARAAVEDAVAGELEWVRRRLRRPAAAAPREPRNPSHR